jgi:hypothetical protein
MSETVQVVVGAAVMALSLAMVVQKVFFLRRRLREVGEERRALPRAAAPLVAAPMEAAADRFSMHPLLQGAVMPTHTRSAVEHSRPAASRSRVASHADAE